MRSLSRDCYRRLRAWRDCTKKGQHLDDEVRTLFHVHRELTPRIVAVRGILLVVFFVIKERRKRKLNFGANTGFDNGFSVFDRALTSSIDLFGLFVRNIVKRVVLVRHSLVELGLGDGGQAILEKPTRQ